MSHPTTTTTPDAESVPCHVVRCLTPAAWRLTVSDHGEVVTSNCYCAAHAAQNVEALPRPGRRVTLDALQVEAVARCRCGHPYSDHTHPIPGGSCMVCARVEGGLRCHHWHGPAVGAASGSVLTCPAWCDAAAQGAGHDTSQLVGGGWVFWHEHVVSADLCLSQEITVTEPTPGTLQAGRGPIVVRLDWPEDVDMSADDCERLAGRLTAAAAQLREVEAVAR